MNTLNCQSLAGFGALSCVIFTYCSVWFMSKKLSISCLLDTPVPIGFSATEEGGALYRRFHRINLFGLLIAATIVTFSFTLPEPASHAHISSITLAGFLLAFTLQAALFLAAYLAGRSMAAPYIVKEGEAHEPYPRSVYSPEDPNRSSPLFKALGIAQYASVGVCVAYLIMHVNTLASENPIQWNNPVDVPSWITKSIWPALGIPMLALIELAMLLDKIRKLTKPVFWVLIHGSLFIAAMAFYTWMTLEMTGIGILTLFLIFLMASGVVALAYWVVLHKLQSIATPCCPVMRSKEELVRERADLRYWDFGTYYHNPNDPALRVRKILGGWGTTSNMAWKDGWFTSWAFMFCFFFFCGGYGYVLFMTIMHSLS